MVSAETDKLLVNLEKIERGLSKIYGHLALQNQFSRPVKAFWDTMQREESEHAQVFHEIHERANKDDSFEIDIDIDLNDLKSFVEKVNHLLKKVKNESVTESEAYSLGAMIEAELDEAHFLNKIYASDEKIYLSIKKLVNDTKKHNILLVNYSRGIR